MADHELVTIQSFFNSTAASLAKARLEGSGIQCHLANRISGGLEDPLGAVQVQVRGTDVERAREILTEKVPEGDAPPPDPADGPPCPKCKEQYAYLETRVMGALRRAALGGTPARRWHCRKCQHDWPE